MADAPPHRDPEAQTAEADGRDHTTTGMPRWVKVSLILGLAVVLLFAVGKLTGVGGDHGPGRHGGGTPSSVVDENGGHRPPVDHGL